MKNILNKQFLFAVILTIAGIISIAVSSRFIKIDPSIKSLLPNDKNLERSLSLINLSPIMDKVIIYINVNDKNNIDEAINTIDNTIEKSGIKFTNSIPSFDDIQDLMNYTSKYSLLLYPYESKQNPFTEEEIKTRLKNKSEFLNSMIFYNPDESFYMDPLMMGTDVLKSANQMNKNKYSPYKGGILSDNGKSYLKVLSSGILPEDYENTKKIVDLDKEINKIAKSKGFTGFLYGSHLYFNESYNTIVRDVNIIFILSIALVIAIFFFFFRKIILSFYSFIPILMGFAAAFLFIAIFKNKFGGIAFAFGGTTAGIAIDYSIYYLSKRMNYQTLKDIRKDIGLSLLLGFMTTISAFVFLLFSGIESLKEIAIFGILSVGFAFIFSYFVLQRLLPPSTGINKIKAINFKLMGAKGFIIWCAIILFLAAFLPFIKFEDDIYKLDMNHKKFNNRLKIIKTDFNESTDNLFLVFEGTSKDEVLEKSHQSLMVLQKEKSNLSFFSPSLFIPPQKVISSRKDFVKNNFNKKIFADNMYNSPFNTDAFNKWYDTIKNIDDFNITKIPAYISTESSKMFVSLNNKIYLMIQIHDRKICNEISRILSKNNIDSFTVDILKDGRDSLIKFEKNTLLLLILSFFIIITILLIAYKNIIHTITALLPAIAGLIAAISIAIITMGKFNIMHLVSCILILGIGVDYGIFVVSTYRSNQHNDIGQTLQSIFICALTAIAGFGTLSISSNYSIFSIGSTILAGIIISFLTSYLALPFILNKFPVKKQIEK